MAMDKIDRELRDKLEEVLKLGISEDAKKAINKSVDDVIYRITTDLEYEVHDQLAHHLACWVADMAQRTVEQMLEGNEDQMRRYLGCEKRSEDGSYIGWTGRSDADYWGARRQDHEWHSVIHGKLFEQGAVALRKKIVDAHRDVLVNERILDLEDQVKSLVAQVNKAVAEKEAMWERVRQYA